MALEDRDWHREESSERWWREADRVTEEHGATRSAPPLGGIPLLPWLLAVAAVTALLVGFGWKPWQSGGTPNPTAPEPVLPATPDPNAVRLEASATLDMRGSSRTRWCVTTRKGEEVCAIAEPGATGRDVLTRALVAKGYRVEAPS